MCYSHAEIENKKNEKSLQMQALFLWDFGDLKGFIIFVPPTYNNLF